jgi:tetratricopeptide (TPR) repeat protein
LEDAVELKLKAISQDGISEALSKAQLYRYLNEPEESESICHDILAVDPENQMALRTLGLAITDQFTGQMNDRFTEADAAFARLTDPYERHYYTGLLQERRAKAQMQAGRPSSTVAEQFKVAMDHFDQAEKIHPAGNDDAVLRWNRCVRLLQSMPVPISETKENILEDYDVPTPLMNRSNRAAGK